MSKRYDTITYIGRFQPFHYGHKAVIDNALLLAERVIIVLGSANCTRDPRNPFTWSERRDMIRLCFPQAEQDRLVFVPQEDHPYNHDRWLSELTHKVYGAAMAKFKAGPYENALIGFDKDHTSFYLKQFPHWDKIPFEPARMINATDIRRQFFGTECHESSTEKLDTVLPEAVRLWLETWEKDNPTLHNHLKEEWNFYDGYRRAWEKAPYPPTFVTADAVVTQDAHVLLVRRKARPGQGLLALPGGFVNQTEKIKDGVIRELLEETKIKVPPAVLRGSIVNSRVFDDPGRSLRGRTITHAYHFRLNEKTLPKVKGGDDASAADWYLLSDLRRDDLFEDHFAIIETMTGV